MLDGRGRGRGHDERERSGDLDLKETFADTQIDLVNGRSKRYTRQQFMTSFLARALMLTRGVGFRCSFLIGPPRSSNCSNGPW